uniref:Uncharacterized protein n=1 Tax=Neisseria meningitidis alpha522 TaxID=996307 RepID=I4E7N4_NEIME|nr:hypothetical protein NMALPHA522_1811 [Neisseria meningitidis alpha522]
MGIDARCYSQFCRQEQMPELRLFQTASEQLLCRLKTEPF